MKPELEFDRPKGGLLPYGAPACAFSRLLLFGIRRMAAGGLHDAHAAHAMFAGFGINFRRPLILLRALMAETSRVSTVKLLVAPCCCPRMTAHEQALIGAIVGANAAPRASAAALADLLRIRSALGVLSSAQAVEASFADLGMKLAPND